MIRLAKSLGDRGESLQNADRPFPMNADDFAALIAGLESAGMTRPEIAQRAKISRNTVWRLANRVAPEPKYETVRRLAELAETRHVQSIRPIERKSG